MLIEINEADAAVIAGALLAMIHSPRIDYSLQAVCKDLLDRILGAASPEFRAEAESHISSLSGGKTQ